MQIISKEQAMTTDKKKFSFSPQQLKALSLDKTNMLVSAGAGSGKTAVLAERVLRILTTANVPLDSILVLTFTDLGAQEFRDRIKKKLLESDEHAHKAFAVDSADIMTFDAYALKLLKKYGYRLNFNSDIVNIDEATEQLLIKRAFNEEMAIEYEKPSPELKRFARRFLEKDDEPLLEMVKTLINAANLTLDPQSYLENFTKRYYSPQNFTKICADLDRYLIDLLRAIESQVKLLSDPKHVERYQGFFDKIGTILTFDDYMAQREDFKKQRMPNNSTKEFPEDTYVKEAIDKLYLKVAVVEKLSSTDEMHKTFMEEGEYAAFVAALALKIFAKTTERKAKMHAFTFSDVARNAYKLISLPDIQDELKKQYEYILVDEYQDTSDIQEEFVSKIANDNLYMVGDIKQSIYGFRNANVYIFKEKYANFAAKKGGRLIVLNDNYRSRNEVLVAINTILSTIMSESYGGANYAKEHVIGYGNKAYDSNFELGQDVGLKVIKYSRDILENDDEENDQEYGNDKPTFIDIEAQLVIKDIQERINNKEKIYDAKAEVMREIRYSDFAILVSRKTHFSRIENNFLNAGVPIFLDDDKTIKEEKVFIALVSLIKLFVYYLKEAQPTHADYRFEVASFLRSFVNNYTDQELLDLMGNNNTDFSADPVLTKIRELAMTHTTSSVMTIVNSLVETFDLYGAIYHLGNVAENSIKLTSKLTQIENLAKLGLTIEEIAEYFEETSDEEKDMSIRRARLVDDAVLLMSIHRSKGLEFPIVYYIDLMPNFTLQEKRQKNKVYSDYGLAFANVKDASSVNEILSLDAKLKENLSERIRLLYVALTRARELMVVIHAVDEKETHLEPLNTQNNFRNLLLQSEYFRNAGTSDDISLETTSTKPLIPEYRGESTIKLASHGINFTRTPVVITREEPIIINDKILKMGTMLHRQIELYDFETKKLDYITNRYEREHIRKLLALPIFKMATNENVYREYTYIDEETHKTYTIDFFILGARQITLIDFKMSNIDVESYDEQVRRYAAHLSKVFSRPVEGYLLSIMNKNYRKVDINE